MRVSRAGLRRMVILSAAVLYLPGCAFLIGGAAVGGAVGAVSSAKESQEESHAPVTYVGTVLANVVYFPAKVLLAGAGAVTSGVAYLATLGDADTSRSIWDSSVNGDYVITPTMIEGKEPVRFLG